jgi:sulfur-carrier protein
MSVKVLFFGKLVEIAGSSVTIDKVQTSNELLQQLQQSYPELINEKYIVAVDKKMIQTDTALTDGCSVALLPPFSGG